MSSEINIGDILSQVMSDPALMANLKETAGALFGQEATAPSPSPEKFGSEPADPSVAAPLDDGNVAASAAVPINSNKPSVLGGEENEHRRRLLLALRPYMDEGRRDKIDMLVKILDLMKLSDLGGLLKDLF